MKMTLCVGCCAGVLVLASACAQKSTSEETFLKSLTFIRVDKDTAHQYCKVYEAKKPFDALFPGAADAFSEKKGWKVTKHENRALFEHTPGVNGGLKTIVTIFAGQAHKDTSTENELKNWTVVLTNEIKMDKHKAGT